MQSTVTFICYSILVPTDPETLYHSMLQYSCKRIICAVDDRKPGDEAKNCNRGNPILVEDFCSSRIYAVNPISFAE